MGTSGAFRLGAVLGNTTNVTIENASFDSCSSAVIGSNSASTKVLSVSFNNCSVGAKLIEDPYSNNGSVVAACRFINNGGTIATADLIVDSTADSCSNITFAGGLKGSVVSRCTVSRCSGAGPFILGTNVSECSVVNCQGGNAIIGRFVSRCAVEGVTFAGPGIPLTAITALGGGFVEDSLVSGCESSGAPATGISASRVVECRVGGLAAHGDNMVGIRSRSGPPGVGGVFRCTVDGTLADSDTLTMTGILSEGAVEECTVTYCKNVGILSYGGGVRNCVIGNSDTGIQVSSLDLPNRVRETPCRPALRWDSAFRDLHS